MLLHVIREAGYLEIAFEYRSAEGQPERLAAAAKELAAVPVDIIVTSGTAATRAAQQATSTIPIVMIAIGDPVRAGLVPNLGRPGGNITGNSMLGAEMTLRLINDHLKHPDRNLLEGVLSSGRRRCPGFNGPLSKRKALAFLAPDTQFPLSAHFLERKLEEVMDRELHPNGAKFRDSLCSTVSTPYPKNDLQYGTGERGSGERRGGFGCSAGESNPGGGYWGAWRLPCGRTKAGGRIAARSAGYAFVPWPAKIVTKGSSFPVLRERFF